MSRKEESQEAILNRILMEPGNDVCADCGTRSPRWASVTLGIFLCIRCAGIHRRIGVHVTLVKSVNLDTWKPEHIQKCKAVGNARAAAIYEATAPPSAFPNVNDQYALEQWIRSKYERKLYYQAPTSSPPVSSPSPPSSPGSRTRSSRPSSATAHRRSRSKEEALPTPAAAPSASPLAVASPAGYTSGFTTSPPTATAPSLVFAPPAPAPTFDFLTAGPPTTTTTATTPAAAPLTFDIFTAGSQGVAPSPTAGPATAAPLGHLQSASMPSFSLVSTMGSPTTIHSQTPVSSPTLFPQVVPIHTPSPAPSSVAFPFPTATPTPTTTASSPFAGMTFPAGPTAAAPAPSPLSSFSSPDVRTYASAKAEIMQHFQPVPASPAYSHSYATTPQPTYPHYGASIPGANPYLYQGFGQIPS